jgi:hypothetical protein
MGIAAELRGPPEVREGRTEIGKKAAGDRSIAAYRARPQGEGQGSNLHFEDLFEIASG